MERRIGKDGLVIDGNTIYEIDLECYTCLSEQEREAYFSQKRPTSEDLIDRTEKSGGA